MWNPSSTLREIEVRRVVWWVDAKMVIKITKPTSDTRITINTRVNAEKSEVNSRMLNLCRVVLCQSHDGRRKSERWKSVVKISTRTAKVKSHDIPFGLVRWGCHKEPRQVHVHFSVLQLIGWLLLLLSPSPRRQSGKTQRNKDFHSSEVRNRLLLIKYEWFYGTFDSCNTQWMARD